MIDYPYILFYLFLFAAFVMYLNTPSKFVFWATICATFSFVALRAPSVGADTLEYVQYLTGERSFYNYDTRDLEPLFIVYRTILDYCTNSRLVVMIVNTIVTMFPLYLIIKKFSYNPPLSILFFFAANGTMIYFVGLRQAIGMAFVLIAFFLIWSNVRSRIKIIASIFFVILSFFFHTYSIVISIVFLVVTLVHVNEKAPLYIGSIGSFVVGSIADFFSVEKIFSSYLSFGFTMTSRLDVYLAMENELNENVPILVIMMFFISIVLIRCLKKDQINSPFMRIFIVGVMLGNLFYPIPMLSRVATPFVIFGGIPVTWLFCKDYTVSKISRRTMTIFALVISFLLFGKCVKDNLSYDEKSLDRMHPYKLFIQEYKGKN